jgi:acyl-CoA synthetase (AMP-forming)/AMP-acid ligase II
MLLTQIIERNAQTFADSPAVAHNGRSHNWQQLRQRIAQLAGALQATGVKPGDRVAILALNSDRYLETFFATLWAGAVIVPLNTRWSVEENRYALQDSDAKTLVVDDLFLDIGQNLKNMLSNTQLLNIGEQPAAYAIDLEKTLRESEAIAPHPTDANELAGVFYTGGTTGFPKGVMLSVLNLWSSAMATIVGTRLNQGEINFLHVAPMFHMAGIAAFLGCCIVGAGQSFIPTFEPEQVLTTIEQQQISNTLMVPTMIGMLLSHPEFNAERLRSLQQIIYGASPMPESILSQITAVLPDVEFYQGYGQTELSPFISMLGAEDHKPGADGKDKTRSAGRACACVQIEIRDSEGKALPVGAIGEVAVSGPNTMMGYLNKPEETAKTLINGWVMTGDAGYIDEDGYLFLVDRVKDMIVTGAENVYSAEVESTISTCPGVDAVAVIGIPSERWGEAVHAIVVSQSDVTAADIIEHCKSRIATYKCPKSVDVRRESLPLTAAGKISKVELRKPFWEDSARTIN